jgi:hypothetical protein
MLTNYAATKLLKHSVGIPYVAPTATYIVLYNVAPTDIGGGTIIDVAIAQPIRWGAATTDLDNKTTISNSNIIIWSAASDDWGEVGGWAITDAAVGARNIIWVGEFDAPLENVGIGDQFTIAAGDIVLGLD